MASINSRNGKLVVDFRYEKQRCRETTVYADTPGNRKKLRKLVERMEAELVLGTFKYDEYFPNSERGQKLSQLNQLRAASQTNNAPLFSDFSELWFREREGEWRKSYIQTVRYTLDSYLIPQLGKSKVNEITKAVIMEFRASLLKTTSHLGTNLSNARINKIMSIARMIIVEASDRFDFPNPWLNIKPLKIKRTDVNPFSLEEIKRFISAVRPDFKNYYIVRFFTGMRTGEIDGLHWENIDFKKRQILVRHSKVMDELVETKTDGSFRQIDMSKTVFDALKSQMKITFEKSDFVFCSPNGSPLQHNNVTKRVWYPTLEYLGLSKRKPYQTRHTAASLWLAAGENAEWIARQLGHANTQMLFKVYSRYVPNLTRQDGSLLDKVLTEHLNDLNKSED